MPIFDVSVGTLGLLFLRALDDRAVLDQVPKPNKARHQNWDEPELHRLSPQSDSHREQGRDGDVAVASIYEAIVVQLGGREYRPSLVGIAFPLDVGQEEGDDERGDQHQNVPPRGVIERRAVGERLGKNQHASDSCAEVDVAGEERSELPDRVQGQSAVFEHLGDYQHGNRRQRPADRQRDEHAVTCHPAEAGEQANLVRSIHCESPLSDR